MIYLYGAIVGVVTFFILKMAVTMAVKDALTSEEVSYSLSNAISRGIELHKQESED